MVRVGVAVGADHGPHRVSDGLVVLSHDVLDQYRDARTLAEFTGGVPIHVDAVSPAVREHERERRVVELGLEERSRRVVSVCDRSDAVDAAERRRRRGAERTVTVVDEHAVELRIGHTHE